MNWFGPLVVVVSLYLIWNTFWAVLPLLVGIMVGIGLQERFPRLSSVIDDFIHSLGDPAKGSTDITPAPQKKRRQQSTDA